MPNADHSELAKPVPVALPLVQSMIAVGVPPSPCATTLVCPPTSLMLTPDVVHTVEVAEAAHVSVTVAAPACVLPPPFWLALDVSCHRLVAGSVPRSVNLPATAIVI